MSVPWVHVGLGTLAETAVEATVLLGLAQAVAHRLPCPAQRHRVRAIGLLALPLLAIGAPGELDAPAWLLAVWLGGVLATLAPLTRSLVGLARATAHSRPGPEGARISADVQVPLTWGLFRPVVLLPEGWPELDYTLAHERAHIARLDWGVQLASELVCALLWFHPMAWWVRRDLLLDAELAADRRVIEQGASPRSYAQHLLDRFEGARAPLAATPGGRPSQLGARVRAALAPTSARRGAWVLLLLPVLLGLSAFSPLPEVEPTCNPTLPESP